MKKYRIIIILSWILLLIPALLEATTLNSDRYADITFNDTTYTYKSFNDNTGSFDSPTKLQLSGGDDIANVKGMVFGDIYDAGRNDLVVANGAKVLLFRCTSPETYSNTGVLISNLDAVDVALGDITGDGLADVVYSDGYWVYWRQNNGNGTFGVENGFWKPKQTGETDLALGDVDGDGYAELIATFATNGSCYLVDNNGGTLDPLDITTLQSSGCGNGVELADLNNDGKLDLLFGSGYQGYTCLGNGNGTFESAWKFTDGDVSDLACADFNGDGFDDVVYADSAQVRYMINTGSGNYFYDADSVQLSENDSSSVAVVRNITDNSAVSRGEIAVKELAGVARSNWPLEVGITFVEGEVSDGNTIVIKDQNGVSLPTQVSIIQRWDDNSIRYALVIFETDLAANSEPFFFIGTGTPPATSLTVTGSGDKIVSTGAAEFTINGGSGDQIISAVRNGFDAINPGGDISLWCSYAYDVSTPTWIKPRNDPSPTMTVVENGPVRSIIKKSHYANGFRVDVYFYFYANQPWLRIYSWAVRESDFTPLISREIALDVFDLVYNGTDNQTDSYSRYSSDTVALDEYVTVEQGAVDTAIILPWFRELGMDSNSNMECIWDADANNATIKWHPIYSDDINISPMNGNCWIDRYWREAAVLLYTSQEADLAKAIKYDLELRGVDVRVIDPAYDGTFYSLREGMILEDMYSDSKKMADYLLETYLSEDYPSSTGEQGAYNWYSAYIYGSSFRYTDVNVPRFGRARNQRAEEIEYLLAMYKLSGKHEYLQKALLKSRFICTQVRDSDGLVRYHAEPAPPQVVGVATPYTHRIWTPMFLAWLQTGDPMFDEVWQDTIEGFHTAVPPNNIYSHRNQFGIREYLRLYSLTGDSTYRQWAIDLADFASKELTKVLPFWTDYNMQHMNIDSDNLNIHTNLYQAEAFADIFDETSDTDYWNTHEALLSAFGDQLDGSVYKDETGDGVMEARTLEDPYNANHIPMSIQASLLNLNSYKHSLVPDLLTKTASYIDWFKNYGMSDYYGNGSRVVWETNDEFDPNNHSAITDNGFAQSWYYWLAADYCQELTPNEYISESKRLRIELPLILDNGLESLSSYGLRWTAGTLEHDYPDANEIKMNISQTSGALELFVAVPDDWNAVSLTIDDVWQENLAAQTDNFDIGFNDSSNTYMSVNKSDRGFGQPAVLLTSGNESVGSVKAMDFGDIYGSGRNDLVIANGVKVLLYQCISENTYNSPPTLISNLDAVSVALGDIDQDGDRDIAYTDGYWIYWAKNFGGGVFDINDSNSTDILISKPKLFGETDIALGDLNGNGYPDLVVTFNNGAIYWQENMYDTNGVFADLSQITGASGGGGVTLGNINNNGYLDLIYSDGTNGYYAIGNGDGSFNNINTQFSSNTGIKDLCAADFNGDSYDDLVVATGQAVFYNLNIGSAIFFQDVNWTELSTLDSESVAVINRDREKYVSINIDNIGDSFIELSKSQSHCRIPIVGDLNGDCYIDWQDLVIFCEHWLEFGG